jgi:hypothetical protein
MRLRHLSYGVAVALTTAGCKPGTVMHLADASPAKLEPGWTLAQDAESGVSIGVPSGWTEGTGLAADSPLANGPMGGGDPSPALDPNSDAGQMSAAIGQMGQAMGEQNEKKERDRLRANGVVINVTDGSKSTVGEQRTRFYVKRIKHDSPYPFELAVLDEKKHLLKPGEGEDVTLPVGKAHRFKTDNTMITGDKETQISYVLADGSDTYLIRFISTNLPTVFDPFEHQVAESFRIKHRA